MLLSMEPTLAGGYNESVDTLHPWDVTPGQARALQERLSSLVVRRDDAPQVQWIAGADVHYPSKDLARGRRCCFTFRR